MASRKETSIHNRMIRIIMLEDPNAEIPVVVMGSATTHDNDLSQIRIYDQEITNDLSPEDLQLLLPFFERFQTRLLTDLEISAEDLTEGAAAEAARHPPEEEEEEE